MPPTKVWAQHATQTIGMETTGRSTEIQRRFVLKWNNITADSLVTPLNHPDTWSNNSVDGNILDGIVEGVSLLRDCLMSILLMTASRLQRLKQQRKELPGQLHLSARLTLHISSTSREALLDPHNPSSVHSSFICLRKRDPHSRPSRNSLTPRTKKRVMISRHLNPIV